MRISHDFWGLFKVEILLFLDNKYCHYNPCFSRKNLSVLWIPQKRLFFQWSMYMYIDNIKDKPKYQKGQRRKALLNEYTHHISYLLLLRMEYLHISVCTVCTLYSEHYSYSSSFTEMILQRRYYIGWLTNALLWYYRVAHQRFALIL